MDKNLGINSISAALSWARSHLKDSGIDDSFLEAEVLLASVTGLDRAGLYRESERELKQEEAFLFQRLVRRRAQKEPVAYLTGFKEFMGLEFEVNPEVLIPRPETELLVEKALDIARKRALDSKRLSGCFRTNIFIADVGTGSGAIAVSLAKYLPEARILATDFSAGALAVARKNALRHGVEKRITFFEGDLLSPLLELNLQGKIFIIAANLPYIPSAELPGLMPDVRCYEPRLALDGGKNGLDHYQRLLPQARDLLTSSGCLLIEIGPGQGNEIGCLLEEDGGYYEIVLDLAGRERVVLAKPGPASS
jgi:release factor glutamine methyltransferase